MPPSTRPKTKSPVTPESIKDLVMLGSPSLSPDGARVAFVHKKIGSKNNYVTNIWMMDTDRGNPVQFTNGSRDGAPAWSPDGQWIAFVSSREQQSPQVYVIPSDGGEARALTDLPEGAITQLKWSPNGTQVAFSFREQAEELTRSATRDRKEAGGTTPPLVTEGAFYRLDGDGYFGERRFKLHVA